MADERFRSYRSRVPSARDQNHAAGPAVDDPLAELARLIGQGDPYAESAGRDARGTGRVEESAPAGLDWASDDGVHGERSRGEDRYGRPPPSLPPASSFGSFAPPVAAHEDEPPIGGRHALPAEPGFDDTREGADDQADDGYGSEPGRPEHDDEDERYGAAGDYGDKPAPRRRQGLVVVMAVLCLVVIGVAGAFGYRAMFGSSMLPMLPPIIKASGGPNKILPSHGASQAENAASPSAGSAGSTEKVVSREEQPVNMETPKIDSRVVSTTPVTPAQNPSMSQTASVAGTPPVSAAGAAGLPIASAAASPWPAVNPAPATASAPSAASAPPAAPASAQSEPRKVHTVTIRAGQPATADAPPLAAPPLPPPAPTRHSSHSASSTGRPGASANAPLSIIPGAEADAVAPPHMRTAAAAPTAASVPAASSGHYAVQVTSQHSEADAQASFKALQARFPNQLGGREPIIRRADLGSKGVYYRALVGPFASLEAATGMCSSLKAAGGRCLVQRN